MSDNPPPLSDPEWTALEAIATSESGATLETAAIASLERRGLIRKDGAGYQVTMAGEAQRASRWTTG